jgi:serine/threonine protein kinase
LYAETPRRWRRIIVSVTFSTIQEHSIISEVFATDNNEGACKVLPKEVQSSFGSMFHQLQLSSSVSRLSLSLIEDESGRFKPDPSRIKVVEDMLEKDKSREDQILQDIEDMGCTMFLESEIAVNARITSTCFKVMVNGLKCVEQKVPFASAGKKGENGFQDFFNDLKLHNSLRDCSGVARFIGVVLDETRTHLRSYLYESPTIMTLQRLFTIASAKSETIPWSIREIWSQQIVNAVSEIHSRSLVVGVLNMEAISIRADGAAILTRVKTSHRHLENEKGNMPPELRNILKDGDNNQRQMMSFRTDIFQLGFVLWLLAEHKSGSGASYLCVNSACTAFPRSKCTAEHTNPIELPDCYSGVPPYFTKIIRECRSPDPRGRPTAHALAENLAFKASIPPDTIRLVNRFAQETDYFCVTCDECGELTSDIHYHCNVCRLGNFDLCLKCFVLGVRCMNSEHRLVKRLIRSGRLVDGSSN